MVATPPSPVRRLLLAAVALTLLLAACSVRLGGGDGEDDDTTAPAPSTTAPAADDSPEPAPDDDEPEEEPEPEEAGDVEIGELVYRADWSDVVADGWTRSPEITYGSGGMVVALGASKGFLVVPAAVAFAPDLYVVAQFDQGRVPSADDAEPGVACRRDGNAFYGVAVRQGEPVGGGRAEYDWTLYRAAPDGSITVLDEAEDPARATAGVVEIGLSCTDHPDGVQVDVSLGSEWVGGAIDTDPLPTGDPAVFITTGEGPSSFAVTTFRVWETTRG